MPKGPSTGSSTQREDARTSLAHTIPPPLSLGRWFPSFRSIPFTKNRLIRPSIVLGLEAIPFGYGPQTRGY